MYYRELRYKVRPWMKANYPGGNYVWQQDEATPHTATSVQKFCKNNFSKFWAYQPVASLITRLELP